ncbi:MAG: DUF559 domain-containing protein [Flavisolibacter sp.]
MYHLPYNKNLKEFSRHLRNHSTNGEILLWKQLRAGSMMGYTFNRQKPLGQLRPPFDSPNGGRPIALTLLIEDAFILLES